MQWKQPMFILSFCQPSFMKQPLRSQQHSMHLQAERAVARDRHTDIPAPRRDKAELPCPTDRACHICSKPGKLVLQPLLGFGEHKLPAALQAVPERSSLGAPQKPQQPEDTAGHCLGPCHTQGGVQGTSESGEGGDGFPNLLLLSAIFYRKGQYKEKKKSKIFF